VRVGVDTGGTFTDLVADDGRVVKLPSTPDDPSRAIAAAVEQLGAGRPAILAHGTTVATNALLERRGAAVTLVTNDGFTDVVEIARQDRPSLYDQYADRPEPLLPRERRIGVRGRIGARGEVIEELDPAAVPDVPDGTEAVAVCLLHADLNPAHEALVAAELRHRGFDVSASHEVSPEFREYERTVTTVANAYLRPVCRAYLERLHECAEQVYTMSSAGGLLRLDEAGRVPVALVLSGPAGGARAGAAVAEACGWSEAITFDMGGTSTDVCLVAGGVPAPSAERRVGGLPIRMPSLDIHTIGAGGGSVAAVDVGGALTVGPRSAGARPGPACYGLGGQEPTVTDANLLTGHLPAGSVLPGLGALDAEAARAAHERAGIDPAGVIDVVNANMEQALRAVSVERGVDPRGLALVAFGGAGPLHACALAEALDMAAVLVPPRAGVLSAVGLLCAPPQRDAVRSWPGGTDLTGLDEAAASLAEEAVGSLGGQAVVQVSFDCRYLGQSHELTVADPAGFHAEHERCNGYAREHWPVEVTAIRASAKLPAPLAIDDLPVPARDVVTGPGVLVEHDCTIWVPAGWDSRVGPLGTLVLERC
jgi:N-methylhydantoinase A/oxoprolinase/acetone carboxylase beta subunit